jgi:FdhE protein
LTVSSQSDRVRTATPEEIALRAGEAQAPFLRLPDPEREFEQRAARLQRLADGHPMRDYLTFVAAIARAQQRVASALSAPQPPDASRLAANRDRCGAALPAVELPREPQWRHALHEILSTLTSGAQLSAAAADSVRRLSAASDTWCDSQADRLLAGITVGLDLGAAPLVAAALQVYWVRLVVETAGRFGAAVFERPASAPTCPCCGFRPTASVVRIGGAEHGYRYLHCALCSSQWHLVRIRCAHCLGTKGINYQALDSSEPGGRSAARDRAPIVAVRAECCDVCGHYLKILSMEKDHEIEPVADDLASVALDLLVSETGKNLAGVNLMLLYGDPGGG